MIPIPFRSEAQRRFLYARHPEIAKRFRRESGPQRGLPERSKRKKSRRHGMYEKAVSRGHGG